MTLRVLQLWGRHNARENHSLYVRELIEAAKMIERRYKKVLPPKLTRKILHTQCHCYVFLVRAKLVIGNILVMLHCAWSNGKYSRLSKIIRKEIESASRRSRRPQVGQQHDDREIRQQHDGIETRHFRAEAWSIRHNTIPIDRPTRMT